MTEQKRNADIRAVDLFCGVGGLTHGLVKGGVIVKAGYDVDPSCKYPYERNNKARFYERDVNELDGDNLREHLAGGDFTLLAGCAPCQPFSSYSQGGRAKKQGGDWQLVATFGRLVKDVQPDFVTMENVAQLAGHPVFQEFLIFLEDYHKEWSIVELANLGVPQSRKRLVLLASKHSNSGLALSMAGKDKRRTVRDAIARMPPIKAGESDPGDPLHTASGLSELNLRRIQASIPGGTWRDWDPALLAACHLKDSGATYPSVYGRMTWDDTAPTITTQCFGYGNGRFGHPEQDRAISLREAAMLQTFPSRYEFVEPGAPVRFNKLGRLIGNAVPVDLGRAIAQTFVKHADRLLRR